MSITSDDNTINESIYNSDSDSESCTSSSSSSNSDTNLDNTSTTVEYYELTLSYTFKIPAGEQNTPKFKHLKKNLKSAYYKKCNEANYESLQERFLGFYIEHKKYLIVDYKPYTTIKDINFKQYKPKFVKGSWDNWKTYYKLNYYFIDKDGYDSYKKYGSMGIVYYIKIEKILHDKFYTYKFLDESKKWIEPADSADTIVNEFGTFNNILQTYIPSKDN